MLTMQVTKDVLTATNPSIQSTIAYAYVSAIIVPDMVVQVSEDDAGVVKWLLEDAQVNIELIRSFRAMGMAQGERYEQIILLAALLMYIADDDQGLAKYELDDYLEVLDDFKETRHITASGIELIDEICREISEVPSVSPHSLYMDNVRRCGIILRLVNSAIRRLLYQ